MIAVPDALSFGPGHVAEAEARREVGRDVRDGKRRQRAEDG
jgi:hypothetical protein